MKKAFYLLCASALMLMTSCDKCATCTSTDTVTGEALEEEFCDTGHSYDNTLKVYEDNNWNCTED